MVIIYGSWSGDWRILEDFVSFIVGERIYVGLCALMLLALLFWNPVNRALERLRARFVGPAQLALAPNEGVDAGLLQHEE